MSNAADSISAIFAWAKKFLASWDFFLKPEKKIIRAENTSRIDNMNSKHVHQWVRAIIKNLDQSAFPPLQACSDDEFYPCFYRGNSYSQDMCQLVTQNKAKGNNNAMQIGQHQQQYKHPHPIAMRRTTYWQSNFGYSRAFRRTDNNRSTCEVLGMSIVCQDFHVTCFLESTAENVNDFLLQMSRWNPSHESHSES